MCIRDRNQLHCTLIILVFILLISFLSAYILFDIGTRLCKARNGQSLVDVSKRQVYINPLRERIEICNNVYLRQFTARHNIPTVNIYCCLVL